MAPRSRLKVLNSEFAEDLVSLLPLQPTLGEVKSPLEDWLVSDVLVIEVPVLEFGKESVHNALHRLAIRARALQQSMWQRPHIMLVVTPRTSTGSEGHRTQSRGEYNMERPIRRWNVWMSCPFQLKGFCSCRFADDGKGVHTRYYVGTSFTAPWDEPGWNEGFCEKPAMRPSAAHLPMGVKQGLCEIIRYASHALQVRSDSHIPRLVSTEGDDVGQLPMHVAAPLGHGGLNPTVGGASADTRLADTAVFAPDPVAHVPSDPTAKADTGASPAYPTDSK